MDSFAEELPLDAELAPELDAPCCAPERRWACRVEERGRRKFRIHLSGSLHAGWSGRLAGGLARRGIGIVRVTAHRSAEMIWEAEVDVEAAGPGIDLAGFDFLAPTLAHAAPVVRAPGVPIDRFSLVRGADDVAVEIRAPDRVGLLDALLRVFASHGLFPRELRIDTRGAVAVDLFLLQTLGGRPPPATVVAALERRLEALARR
jgi:hypothetical protein